MRESSKRTLQSTSSMPRTRSSASATEYAVSSSNSPPRAACAESTASRVPATSTRRLSGMKLRSELDEARCRDIDAVGFRHEVALLPRPVLGRPRYEGGGKTLRLG